MTLNVIEVATVAIEKHGLNGVFSFCSKIASFLDFLFRKLDRLLFGTIWHDFLLIKLQLKAPL
jgi:hypothetical protein